MLPTVPSSRRPDLRPAAMATIAAALVAEVELLCATPDPRAVDQVGLEAAIIRLQDLDGRLTALADAGYPEGDDRAVRTVEAAVETIVLALHRLETRRGVEDATGGARAPTAVATRPPASAAR